jgi:hypothetical protein
MSVTKLMSLEYFNTYCSVRYIYVHVKVKINFSLEQAMKEKRHNSALSLTLTLDVSKLLVPNLCRITPEIETRYPLYRRLGGP